MRVHSTTGQIPTVQFGREERRALCVLAGRLPFCLMHELTRRVQVVLSRLPEGDACMDIYTNYYSFRDG